MKFDIYRLFFKNIKFIFKIITNKQIYFNDIDMFYINKIFYFA